MRGAYALDTGQSVATKITTLACAPVENGARARPLTSRTRRLRTRSACLADAGGEGGPAERATTGHRMRPHHTRPTRMDTTPRLFWPAGRDGRGQLSMF